MKIGEDTFSRFKKIIHNLSLYPPLPAGEGLNYEKIIENIYHFYRTLNLKDLKLIRLIAKNEADSMEINLALFYRWLVSGDQCTKKGRLPPSPDTLYRYAGFFVNSIGGRAYLFRRATRLRLLLSYYSLLIVHEADKKKMTWLLGGQPSPAEVVKGEKEALVILLGLSPPVNRFRNYFSIFFREAARRANTSRTWAQHSGFSVVVGAAGCPVIGLSVRAGACVRP